MMLRPLGLIALAAALIPSPLPAQRILTATDASGAVAQRTRTRTRTRDTTAATPATPATPWTVHRPWMPYSYTDFYFPHHPKDTADLRIMGTRVDRVTNGDRALWHAANPTIVQTQYRLFWFALASGPDTLGATGVGPADAFLVAHGYPLESAFLHRKDSGVTPAHRLTWIAADGDTAVAFNPADAGFRAYQASVLAGLIREGYTGAFYDVFGRGAMSKAFTTAEGDSIWFRDAIAAALRATRAPFPGAVLTVNTASYDFPFDSACIVAAGAAHLERTNYPLGFNETRYWRWIDKLVASGATLIEFVSNLAWFDKLPKTYVVGNDATPRGREKMAEYEAYQMVRDAGGVVSFAPDNYWRSLPVADWLAAWDVDIGQPIASRHKLLIGKDPLGQGFTVYARRTTKALVLLRPGGHAKDFGDRSAVRVSLGGTYRPLRSDGVLGVPDSTITLRAAEGAILVR